MPKKNEIRKTLCVCVCDSEGKTRGKISEKLSVKINCVKVTLTQQNTRRNSGIDNNVCVLHSSADVTIRLGGG